MRPARHLERNCLLVSDRAQSTEALFYERPAWRGRIKVHLLRGPDSRSGSRQRFMHAGAAVHPGDLRDWGTVGNDPEQSFAVPMVC